MGHRHPEVRSAAGAPSVAATGRHMIGPAMRGVYTALIGAYERLNEQPVAASSTVPFTCFTDDPGLRSDTWRIVRVDPAFAQDPVRSARRLKILGHPSLDELDETLWIDNSVVLSASPDDILDEWLDGTDVAMPRHSFRDTLMDEFDAVVSAGLDDPARVYEQLQHYADVAPRVLGQPPLWSALIARRHTPAVSRFNALWYEHVLRYSRRDQLSVLMAMSLAPDVSVRAVEIDNYASDLHRWPVKVDRDPTDQGCGPDDAAEPLALKVHGLERTIADMEQAAAAEAQRMRLLESQLEAAQSARRAIERERDDLVRHLEVVEASRTWRAGRVVARVLGPVVRALTRRRRP